ncbi:hypothetical protein AURDEDRAFT_156552 [Auricularia subglabra TFB-10046 SS5]|nr:hypothetical protein AURDEDRAFT_156552 [Auricularia subglabra TFB-10046 SS5]
MDISTPSPPQQLATELYAEIALYLARGDLIALSVASRRLNDVAVRLLYARIDLDGKQTPRSTAKSLLLALKNKKKPIAQFVRHVELHWVPPPKSRDQATELAELLAVVLPRLTNITYFSISPSLDIYGWAFDDVTLPALLQFHSYGPGAISSKFLGRHPQLTHLTMCQTHEGWFLLHEAMPNLVYLRLSCIAIAEQFLQRQHHPTLERIVFGDARHFGTLISALDAHWTHFPHIDVVGKCTYLLHGVGFSAPFSPHAHRVTSLGIACCELRAIAYPSDEGHDPMALGNLENIRQNFPGMTSLAIHCEESSHDHSTKASLAYDNLLTALEEVNGFESVCVTEFLGTRVMSVTRDGQRRSERVPVDHKAQKEYQFIRWPEC